MENTPSRRNLRIVNIVGARPNFMKIAPLMAEYRKYDEIEAILVHTGQHYDEKMSRLFFKELEIPPPDIDLEVGSASHAVQTAEIMKRFEPLVLEYRPDLVLVVGDVNSTIACALVAAKLNVPIAHVEAGLRSFDRRMPEEINRVLTDSITDYLFVTEPSGLRNLRQEGISEEKIFFVGNVMIDTLKRNLTKSATSVIQEELGLSGKDYALVTLHRPANVDDAAILQGFLVALETVGKQLPVIFPVHPRTREKLTRFGLAAGEESQALRGGTSEDTGVRLLEPLGYLDFLKLMAGARVVLTDSGGIQEETTILGVPCLTMRDNTERPITVERGTNRLIGTDPAVIPAMVSQVLGQAGEPDGVPELWDGQAAARIVKVLLDAYQLTGH